MRIILIEDNPQVRELLRSLLSIHWPNAVIVGEAEGIVDGHRLLSSVSADLWLLDIELRDGNVFTLLESLDPAIVDQTALVFLTAFGTYDYVLEALRKSAVDYLLKPVDPPKLIAALEKVQLQTHRRDLGRRLDTLHQLLSEGKKPVAALPSEKIPIFASRGIVHYIPVEDILYFEGEGSITYVHLRQKTGSPLTSVQHLGHYAKTLEDQYGFFRLSKSILVNRGHITRIDQANGTVFLSEGRTIVGSRRSFKKLLDFFRGLYTPFNPDSPIS